MPQVRRILLQWEDETPLLRAGALALVPFLMEEGAENGEPVLRVEGYRGAEETIRSFLRTYDGNFFTDDALRALHGALRPYFVNVGCRIDEYGVCRYYFAYRLTPGDALPVPHEIPGVTVRLLGEADAAGPSLLTLSPSLLYERQQRRPDLPCAVAVEEKSGKILAAAAVGDAEAEGRVREITVETAVNARGQGLGTAVTACLAAELLRQGFSPFYCCSRWNRASRKIALSLGFRYVGRFYAVSGSRI